MNKNFPGKHSCYSEWRRSFFNNRVRDDEMEEVKAHASTLPAIRFFSIETLKQVVMRYAVGTTSEAIMHLHKAIVGRWKEMMTEEQVELCRVLYGDYIRRMGYDE